MQRLSSSLTKNGEEGQVPSHRKLRASDEGDSCRIYSEIDSDYRLLTCLGQGVSGKVYRAVHRQSGKEVAIKVLKDTSRDFYSLKQVYREIAIHRRLSQMANGPRFVAPLLEVRLAEEKRKAEVVFILMELVAGMTLKDYLDKCQRKEIKLSQRKAKSLVKNLLEALAFVHKAGVIHRDLKPQNIMVEPASLSVRIIDFGLAKTISIGYQQEVPRSEQQRKDLGQRLRGSEAERKSRPRNMSPHVQTRVYRAPEVCLLEQDYSQSVDIWSFGCILAEILQCQKHYTIESPDSQDRYIFPATSCYPLSPEKSLSQARNPLDRLAEADLLKVILGVLGDQESYDLSFLSSESSRRFVKANFAQEGRIQFDKEFEGTQGEFLEIIQYCLQFNPFFRLSAADLLRLPLFENSTLDQLQEESKPFMLAVDEEDAFDYSLLQSLNMKISDLEALIIKEAKRDI